MITEGKYLDALLIVREYIKQIEEEVKLSPKDDFLDSIVVLHPEVGVRARGCIKASYYHPTKNWCYLNDEETIQNGGTLTWRELRGRGKKWLMRQRNFGRKSLIEIEKVFEDNGYDFKN